MRAIVRSASLAVLLLASSWLSGCASTGEQPPQPKERVTSIPWNRPEKWETQGPLGSMLNTQ